MTQKKRPDLNKILRSIFLILGIVFMLLKISARASADSVSPVVSVFSSDINQYNINISESDYNSAIATINSWCNNSSYPFFSVTRIFTSNKILYCITTDGRASMFRSSVSGNSSFSIDFSYNISNAYRFSSLVSYNNINTNNNIEKVISFIYCLDLSNHSFGRIGSSAVNENYLSNSSTLFNVLENNSIINSFYYYEQWSWNLVQNASAGVVSIPLSSVFSDVSVYGYGQLFGSYSDSSKWFISDNWFDHFPLYDSRFSAWTSFDQAGKKLLNVTWDSQAYPNTGNYVYQSSTIALQVAVNGQSSTVSFSSTDYPELFVTGNSSYIPYKFIQKLANIATVEPSDTFYLEKITLTQQAYPSAAGSSASQTFTASTVYSLNLGADVVEIPAVPSVTPVPISETNIVETEYFNNIVGGTISSSDSFPIASWANTYRVAIADGEILDSNNELNGVYYDDCITNEELESFLGSISSSDPSLNVNSIVNFETYSLPVYLWDGLHYFNYFHKLVYDNIKDFTDIAIYDLYYPSTTLRKRFVIYTDSYYYKLQLKSLGSLQNMIESNTYYAKALYDYSYARFNGMAESLESMRISNNNLLSSINANILNLQDLVSSGTDRIVNAINGISSGGGGMSVSDLSGALNTLFMPSFEWDQVNYQDYLDSMGVLALPFEFVFDTQSIIKNNYSASLVMPVNDFSVPLGKDFSDNDIEFTVFEDQEDFTFVPTSIFPAALWSVFQYLAAFGLVIGEAWFTYVHIFRKEEKSGDF